MKKLIFVPYQDVYDYSLTHILTREYSMLSVIMDTGQVDEILCIGKPRTILDYKKYDEANDFPDGSVEKKVKEWLDSAIKKRHEPVFSISQIMGKRRWWCNGYLKTLNQFSMEDYKNYVIYCNTPFAWKLLKELKARGATIIFDMMDNFAIHPSLLQKEKRAAYEGYKECFAIADFISCNSEESQNFCRLKYSVDVELIKNGVFKKSNGDLLSKNGQQTLDNILKLKNMYSCVIGYIGKLGRRIDARLLQNLAEECKNKVFVLIGPQLNDQRNNDLNELFKEYDNILHFDSIPSSDVIPLLNGFDILMIPHSVGKDENGGDPLKLYQYLETGKPIISTNIFGVREFENLIKISNDVNEWKEFFIANEYKKYSQYDIPSCIYWQERCKKLLDYLKKL